MSVTMTVNASDIGRVAEVLAAATIVAEAAGRRLKARAYGTWTSKPLRGGGWELAWPGGSEVDAGALSSSRKYIRIEMDGAWWKCLPHDENASVSIEIG
jgi:hypothetical protein